MKTITRWRRACRLLSAQCAPYGPHDRADTAWAFMRLCEDFALEGKSR